MEAAQHCLQTLISVIVGSVPSGKTAHAGPKAGAARICQGYSHPQMMEAARDAMRIMPDFPAE